MASIEFDHLVIAAAVLDDGIEFARRTYGLEIPLGGKHDMMATHNAVGRIGPDTYLEVISIDPAAPSPSRTRWFSLDDPANRRRLENDGPRVAHWVCRTDDLAGIVEQCSHDIGRILSLTRGSLAWQIAVRDDGLLFEDGLFPTIIQWGERCSSGTEHDRSRGDNDEVSAPSFATAPAYRNAGLNRRRSSDDRFRCGRPKQNLRETGAYLDRFWWHQV